ncbi:MAG: glycosyltransferase family 39 protein, partial [Caldilineaceae bacterium]
DERKWLARSANFYEAVSEGNLAGTFQREHPGVTVMWAGTLGFLQLYPDYPAAAPGPFAWDTEHLESWLTDTGGPNPLDLLAAGRWWIVFAVALATALSFLPLRRLFGVWPAVLAALWIAWDPFAVALSRQLHPDGLVSVLTFLALLTFLAWLYGGRGEERAGWGWLVASGATMGLAWLTKTPAIFLVPVAAVLLVVEALRRDAAPAAWRRLLLAFVVWGAVATLLFVALWPAMWLNPLGTLTSMAGEMGEYVERHTNLNYFWGAPTQDPGLLFYPVAWFFRTTPAVLLGLIAAAWLGRKRMAPLHMSPARRAALALLIFALLFAAGMSLGAKKFDRYILPAFLALDVLAALGWAGFGAWLAQRWQGAGQRMVVVGAGVAVAGFVLLHALFVPIHAPYYLTDFNPLAGGSRLAPFALWVGWGEGLDEAARWLNAQPNASEARTAAFYYDGPFSYFYDGAASNLGYGSPLFWLGMDYAVTYINQQQRRIPAP